MHFPFEHRSNRYSRVVRTPHVDLRRIDLNLLIAFEALVSERSVTRAAGRLGIGQSAMSSTLARLRKLLNDAVLVRNGRELVVTPRAESLLEPVRNILADIEQVLARRDSFDPATDHRTFSVLCINYHLTYSFLHPLLARLDTEAPHVRLHIEGSVHDFADRLQRHDIDFLIVPRDAFPQHQQYPHRVLYEDGYVAVVDRNHPDIDDEMTYEQFCTLPYMATRGLDADAQLEQLGIPRNLEVVTDFGIAAWILRDTRLFTVTHERVATQIADMANLKLLDLPVKGMRPTTEILVWPTTLDCDPAHRWLRQQMFDMATEITAAQRTRSKEPSQNLAGTDPATHAPIHSGSA